MSWQVNSGCSFESTRPCIYLVSSLECMNPRCELRMSTIFWALQYLSSYCANWEEMEKGLPIMFMGIKKSVKKHTTDSVKDILKCNVNILQIWHPEWVGETCERVLMGRKGRVGIQHGASPLLRWSVLGTDAHRCVNLLTGNSPRSYLEGDTGNAQKHSLRHWCGMWHQSVHQH